MKRLKVVRRNSLSILMLVVMLLCVQIVSYADIDSVLPGNNDTSLIVTFTELISEDMWGVESRNYLFKWRQKTPQSSWQSSQKQYTYRWHTYNVFGPDRVPHTRTYTIIGLNPGTMYEVRYDSGSIHEGTTTTDSTPLLISTTHALTEVTLGNATATLTLNNDANEQDISYEQDISKIRDAATVSGIPGVTVDTTTVQRLSDTEITVALDFDGTDFDSDTKLTFGIDAAAIVGDIGETLTAEILVPALIESVSASVVSPLTEAMLDGSTVTLTLTGTTYEQEISTIREGLTVSGISGVTLDTTTAQRISDTKITVELDYDDTDFDTDSALTFSITTGAIANYIGEDITTEIPVTAIREGVTASAVSPLTEASLDVSTVTLTLTGVSYQQDITTIGEGLTVSGISGVTLDTDTVERISDTEITVELNFDGTDFDTDTELTLNIDETALTGDIARAVLTAGIPVTAVTEFVSASVVSPLTEVTLDGGIVTLMLRGEIYEQDISKIGDAVTVSGITGVTVDTDTVERISDTEITVELDYDDTDFVQDRVLTFSVDTGAIADYAGDAFTAKLPVTANRGEAHLIIFWTHSGRDKIQRANLDGSDVQDLVTQGLSSPRGIALDVAGGKMYWTDSGFDKIQRANLDGSNIENLVTQELDGPGGIALDVAGGKMYWTDSGTDRIQRANLDGSNIENLVTQGLSYPNGIALDVAGGKMYWANSGFDKIQRANLDGSNIENLVTQELDGPGGIALDVAGGKMYWTDSGTDRIQRANLDGSNIEDLVTQELDGPDGIALDVAGGKMYWTDSGTDRIQRANLDGSNIENLGIPGLSNPAGIAIGTIFPVDSTTAKEDVNRDGVVDVNDLVIVARRYGSTGSNAADVNGDEIVNVDDFILVAAAVDSAAAAPAARAQVQSHFTKAQLQGWLTEARASGNTSCTYQRGIAVVERLLALFTPVETALLANFPNPFNPETWIPYQLSKDGDVSLHIYAIDGSLVRTLGLGHQVAGVYQSRSRAAYWDGKNDVGEKVASGVYFYTLKADDFSATRKMLIRK